ncbi:MAG: hypothetical protein M3Z04_04220 [Chloroflexota bacterium]|nr:hypothetical protein [Chloroflexota bacterium]
MKSSRFWLAVIGALAGLLLLGGAALADTAKPLGSGPLTPSAGALKPSPKAPPPAGMVNPLQESFESGTLGDFASAVTTCVPGGCGASAVMTYTHSGAYAAFLPDVSNISDQQLVLTSALALPAGATSAGLTFWQRYEFEADPTHSYDGGYSKSPPTAEPPGPMPQRISPWAATMRLLIMPTRIRWAGAWPGPALPAARSSRCRSTSSPISVGA